jgi:O-6-methylguanine DNA methyltransferase
MMKKAEQSSNFKEKVYELLRQVPKGKVVTYGQLAEMVGSKGAARAVGMCMRTNPDAPRTPCHRVVSTDGTLRGYSAGDGLPTKKKMLLEEGVKFTPSGRVDLKLSQWQPSI